jgi:hypothetical protein
MPTEPVFDLVEGRFVATELASGPWDRNAQIGGAPAALLARAFELVPAADRLILTRLTYDFIRPARSARPRCGRRWLATDVEFSCSRGRCWPTGSRSSGPERCVCVSLRQAGSLPAESCRRRARRRAAPASFPGCTARGSRPTRTRSGLSSAGSAAARGRRAFALRVLWWVARRPVLYSGWSRRPTSPQGSAARSIASTTSSSMST